MYIIIFVYNIYIYIVYMYIIIYIYIIWAYIYINISFQAYRYLRTPLGCRSLTQASSLACNPRHSEDSIEFECIPQTHERASTMQSSSQVKAKAEFN